VAELGRRLEAALQEYAEADQTRAAHNAADAAAGDSTAAKQEVEK
jgi:hypothetical protein